MDKDKEDFLDKPRNLKRLLGTFLTVCAGLLLLDFVHRRHVVPGMREPVGLLCPLRLRRLPHPGAGGKEMRKVLMRKEDHYDDL